MKLEIFPSPIKRKTKDAWPGDKASVSNSLTSPPLIVISEPDQLTLDVNKRTLGKRFTVLRQICQVSDAGALTPGASVFLVLRISCD